MADKKTSQEPVELPNNIADLFAAAQAAVQAGEADEWETKFVAENVARFEKFGDRTYLSEKQLAILRRVAAKAAEAHE